MPDRGEFLAAFDRFGGYRPHPAQERAIFAGFALVARDHVYVVVSWCFPSAQGIASTRIPQPRHCTRCHAHSRPRPPAAARTRTVAPPCVVPGTRRLAPRTLPGMV
jgi:hypothetical protein